MPPTVLHLLTFNVWGLPWPVARDRRRRFEGILASLSQRRDHLVGVQELWSGASLPLPGLLRGGTARDSGLALGGQLVEPHHEPRLDHFGVSRGPDGFKAKGVLSLHVDVPDVGRLRVLVTHLQAGAAHASVRARQTDTLLEIAAEEEGTATVVMGDFNYFAGDAEDDASAGRLAAEGFVDAAVAVGRPEPTYDPDNKYTRGRAAQRFDRVLLRSGDDIALAARDAAVLLHDEPLSDHHPLWVRLLAKR